MAHGDYEEDQYNNSNNKRKYDDDTEEDSTEDQPNNKKQKLDGFEVIIKNLPFSVEEDQLTQFFESCGTIEQVKIPRRPTGEARGFGFIQFDSQEGVDAAIALSNEDFEGRTITVALSSKSGGAAPSGGDSEEKKHNIFVGNLSYETTEDSLGKFFESCGNIIAIRMPTDEHTGRKKGFAFVDFDSSDAVDQAVGYNDSELDGRNIRVDRGGPKRNGGGRGGGRGGFGGGRGGRGGGFGGGRGGGFGGGRGGGFGGGRGGGFGGRGGGGRGGFRGGRGGGFGGEFQGKRKTF